VHARIGCRINFDEVEQTFFVDGAANGALVARTIRRFGVKAIDRFGKNARGGCFARAARARKQIRVRDAIQDERVAQCIRDMVLPLHVLKRLWAIFQIKRFGWHFRKRITSLTPIGKRNSVNEFGRRKAEDGRRKTESGRRKKEDGKRKTESGKRKTEDGKRKTESGKRKTEDGKRKTESGKRKTEDG